MKIFDKASWHIDSGMEETDVINKFKKIFDALDSLSLLSDEGYEILDFGIDDSISLNENMVNEKGRLFLEEYYDKIIGYDTNNIAEELHKKYYIFCNKQNNA
ncbi:MAG: hypothetical protein IJ192_05850 [Clostridia bacterium]|nr:hypothetical protein [Clostridia bacterium]